MAECGETKRIINNPRIEIDTSPPFESVKEAVDRFGGSGPWIPHHLLRLAAAHHGSEALDVEKMEEQAVQLERDLIMKEQQTLDVLKELESAKRFVEGLKLNFMPELSSFLSSPDNQKPETISPCLMFMELNQAKSTLNKTSIDLAAIQASVETLNKKMKKEKFSDQNHQLELAKTTKISINFEAEQFKNMTEASRYEVMKAMTEIERTKNSIKMAEMRLNAAKKMEEAAKAVEAIAIAQRTCLEGEDSSPDGITLSFEEYESLINKAKQGPELCKTKFIDDRLQVPILEKFEEPTNENDSNKFMFRNSGRKKGKTGRGFGSTTSIGDLLTKKVITQDHDVTVEDIHSERERVSLSQMLMEKSRLILHPTKQTSDRNVEKQFFVQRKKFGFIQVPLPSKYSKKKTQTYECDLIRVFK